MLRLHQVLGLWVGHSRGPASDVALVLDLGVEGERRRAELLPRLPPEDRAWVRSCGGPGAGAWLNSAPATELERFHDADFCAAVRTRLCQDVSPLGLRCSNTYATGPRAGDHCADDLDNRFPPLPWGGEDGCGPTV